MGYRKLDIESSTLNDVDYTQMRSFRLFWIGFFSFSLISILYAYNIIGTFLLNIGKISCVILMFFSFIQSTIIKFDSRLFRFLFWVYITWQIITIARGFSLDYEILVAYFSDNEFAYFAFIPFIIFLLSDNLYNYKYFIQFLIKLNYLFLAFFALFLFSVIKMVNYFEYDFYIIYTSISVGFLLLIYPYLCPKQKKMTILVWFLSFITVVIFARRNLIFSFLVFIALAYFLNYTYHSKKNVNKKFLLIFFSVVILLSGFFIYNTLKVSLFSTLDERLTVDSRERVTLMFFEDMTERDWLIGKGTAGVYYAPGIDNETSDYRRGIETGLLTVILKGGIVSLLLFWLIAFYAIYNGYYKTNNGFTKGAALLVLFWLIEMYPSGQFAFNIRYLQVWVCIGICISARLRSLTDEDVKYILIGDEK